MKITFPMLLGLTFVVLKLTHVIDWAWIWVTCPFWLGIAIWLVCMLIYGVLLAFESPEDRKKRKAREAIAAMSKALKRT